MFTAIGIEESSKRGKERRRDQLGYKKKGKVTRKDGLWLRRADMKGEIKTRTFM